MIIGLGTDIVELARIEETVGRLGDKFARRILDDTEFEFYQQSPRHINFLGKRFAVKEAAAKALGSGIGRGVSWQHIHVRNRDNGEPYLELSAGAEECMRRLGGTRCHVSLSDERHYAVATVIIEG